MQPPEKVLENLQKERATKMSLLFNPQCLAALHKKGITLTEKMKEEYRRLIQEKYQSQQEPLDWVVEKKHQSKLPFTLDILNDEPYLRLANPVELKNSARKIAAKPMIPLAEAPPLLVKVFRDDSQAYHAENEHNNYTLLGVPTYHKIIRKDSGKKNYLFEPFYEGIDLLDANNQQLITPSLALVLMKKISQAVLELHTKGYLHLDLKPENIIYHPEKESVHLIDFESMAKINTRMVPRIITPEFAHTELIQAYRMKVEMRMHEAYDVSALIDTFLDLIKAALKQSPTLEIDDYLAAQQIYLQEQLWEKRDQMYPAQMLITLPELIEWVDQLKLPGLNESLKL